uniref:NFACT protein C-terminal domain-containing protein n=1 Tax=Panagrolaimus davidi TaxID=227884 RepID=A0A914NXN1_9BILA
MFRLDEESAANHKAAEQEAGSVMSHLSIADENIDEAAEGDEEDEELKDEEEQQNEGKEAVEGEEEAADEEEDDDEFPDVELNDTPKIMNAGEDTEYTMVRFPQPQRGPRKVDPRQQYLEEKKRKEQEEEAAKKAAKQNNQTGPISKRQKHKLDKIKKKYKDQTEEEREQNMILLGVRKPEEIKPEQKPLPPRPPKPQQEKLEAQQQQQGEEDDDEDPEASAEGANEDEVVINELCARTFDDDSLIYVVAVCAPYNSMQKFKYKVKITPGTGKRGKAAKMALQLFLRDKRATPAELNLIKGLVSDNNIASNIPGKVRVSAPQLLKMKK